MGSKVELEEDVCYLQQKIDELKAIIKQKTISLKHATAELNEVRARYQHNRTNYVHMKRDADWVVLDEYKETVKNMLEAKDQVEEAGEKVQRLIFSIEYHNAELEKAQTKLKGRRIVHRKGYGKLIPFPGVQL